MKNRLLLLLGVFASAGASASTPRMALLGHLPLRFEEARGQKTHQKVRYIARGPNFVLSLAPDQSWLEWKDGPRGRTAHVLTRLRNANSSARMQPEDRLPGAANYFLGSPAQWQTDVTGFGRVRYQDVYPGIDLIFHGEQGRLEYDFVLAPRADPSVIRLELSGHRTARVADDGDLVVSTDAGEIRWKRPEIYQTDGGVRQPVAGRFLLSAGSLVRFEIAQYDRKRPLVIDPVLKYSTYIGNKGNDAARGIAVDSAGNVYITGTTSSSDLNTVSAYQPNFGGGTAGPFTGDGFVAKFSSSGTLLYLTYLGGSLDEGVTAIAVDAAGNAYLTGATNSSDFPTVNPFQANFAGFGGSATRAGDAFVAKLSPTGNKLLYSTYLGGTLDDIGLAIAIDSAGNAYIGGATASPNFPLTPGGTPYQSKFGGAGGEPIRHQTDVVPLWEPGDAFVAKLDPTGSKLLFSTYLGGALDDAAFSIAVDSSHNVYVGGCTISYNFPVKNAFQSAYGGADPRNFFFSLGDGFVTKLNPTLSDAIYSTYFGGSGDDCITSIALDSSGAVYMTGATTTQNLKTSPGAFQSAFRGYYNLPFNIAMGFGDAFVAKLDPAGSKLLYLTYLGGSYNDSGTAIAVDSAGDAYVTGFSDSPDFPVVAGALQPALAGDGGLGAYIYYGDAFLTVLNPTGTAALYSSYFGGNGDERTFGLALDGSGTVYIVGNTVSTNLPTTSRAFQKTFGGFDGHVPDAMRGDAYLSVFSGFPLNPPVITSVTNAESQSPIIAANTWVELKGSNFSSGARSWQAPDFVNNQMPTVLDGISVSMNGEKAFVSYISGSQLEVLTPPNLAPGPVRVQVNNGFLSAPVNVQSQQYSLALSIINRGPYVLATHADGTLVAPFGLFPGSSPAALGEPIMVYANGFGGTVPPIVAGSIVQAGVLPSMPAAQIGGAPANVTSAALVYPGFYRFTVTVPASAGSGDVAIAAQYGGQSTQAGVLLSLQQ
ncbi:MAG TPA: SBBP repeat-containing protein [Bryobacteraceae bacterium]|nr:SBBP repeat-containing protein [Bryobacteraceae bacterium]